MPNQYTGLPVEERRGATENVRRAARFRYAEARIRKIAEGEPRLTAEQRHRLARILAPSSTRVAA